MRDYLSLIIILNSIRSNNVNRIDKSIQEKKKQTYRSLKNTKLIFLIWLHKHTHIYIHILYKKKFKKKEHIMKNQIYISV